MMQSMAEVIFLSGMLLQTFMSKHNLDTTSMSTLIAKDVIKTR